MFFFLKHGVRKKQTAENNYSNIDNNNVQVHSRSPISIAIHARTRHRLLLVNDSDMYHTLLCSSYCQICQIFSVDRGCLSWSVGHSLLPVCST